MRLEVVRTYVTLADFAEIRDELTAAGYKVGIRWGADAYQWRKSELPVLDIEKEDKCRYFRAQQEDDWYGYFCDECGNEIWTLNWFPYHYELYHEVCEDPIINKALLRLEDKLKTLVPEDVTVCPCCGKKLIQEPGYYLNLKLSAGGVSIWTWMPGDDFEKNLDRAFAVMAEERVKQDKVRLDNRNKNMQNAGLLATNAVDYELAESVKGNVSKLKAYLANLMTLENNIYSITKRLEQLYPLQREVSRKRKIHLAEYAQNISEATKRYIESCNNAQRFKWGKVDLKVPCKPEKPVMGIPNMLNKKKVLAENQAKEEKYQADLVAYDKALRLYEEEKERLATDAYKAVENAKAALEQAQIRQVDAINLENQKDSYASEIVENEFKEATELLKSLYDARGQLYGLGIVHNRYQNMVALSTFYDYLTIGRCTELEGINGAYNLYESELRANLIIEKLDDIKDTQYMIHSTLMSIDNNLDYLNTLTTTALASVQNMEKNVERIAENTDMIAHNTAISAYYSKINAEMTNALGFMVALK